MAEKHTIIAGDNVSYSGLIQLPDLFSLLNSYLRQIGYDKKVPSNNQQVIGDTTHVSVELKPWKKISDYILFELKINISAKVKDVEINIDGKNTKIQKGSVDISISGGIVSDYNDLWQKKSEYFFLRTLFNKYVYKVKMDEWDSMLKNQVAHLKAELSSFLNMKGFSEHHTKRDMIK